MGTGVFRAGHDLDPSAQRGLIADTDILFMSHGVIEDRYIEIVWQQLKGVNPRLIFCTIRGDRGNGPLTEEAQRRSLVILIHVLASLIERHRSGQGQLLYISEAEGVLPGLDLGIDWQVSETESTRDY
jgi:crotonobetainyl-CoA:carnitine CoA-transferase CaiB-like acyl-CoA transferase